MAIYFETFEKSLDFEGRSTRTEYFVFIFGSVVLGMPLVFLDVLLGMYSSYYGMGPLTALLLIVIFLPSLSLQVRRLHDAGFSGWWFFIGFVPFIGLVAQLLIPLWEGTDGPNEYGVNPRSLCSDSSS